MSNRNRPQIWPRKRGLGPKVLQYIYKITFRSNSPVISFHILDQLKGYSVYDTEKHHLLVISEEIFRIKKNKAICDIVMHWLPISITTFFVDMQSLYFKVIFHALSRKTKYFFFNLLILMQNPFTISNYPGSW